MKAVCFENSIGTKVPGKEPYFYLKPETSFLLNNRPFFIPDYTNDIRAQLFIAIRICKIGKYISEKFAFDYFDAFTVGICFTAFDIYNEYKTKGFSPDIARTFDFSSPIGKFSPKPDRADLSKTCVRLVSGSDECSLIRTSEMEPDLGGMISIASRFISLKIGDLIMATGEISTKPVCINDKFEVICNDVTALSVEIK